MTPIVHYLNDGHFVVIEKFRTVYPNVNQYFECEANIPAVFHSRSDRWAVSLPQHKLTIATLSGQI